MDKELLEKFGDTMNTCDICGGRYGVLPPFCLPVSVCDACRKEYKWWKEEYLFTIFKFIKKGFR